MTQVKFIRTTHDHNGRCRSFPAEAWQFWREHGAVVGEVLRAEILMTFAEIVTAGQEYALEHPESGLCSTLDEGHVAWCLIELLQYGMAGVVVETIHTANAIH